MLLGTRMLNTPCRKETSAIATSAINNAWAICNMVFYVFTYIKVVLPAPFVPSRPKHCPAGIPRDTFLTASFPLSYCFVS